MIKKQLPCIDCKKMVEIITSPDFKVETVLCSDCRKSGNKVTKLVNGKPKTSKVN